MVAFPLTLLALAAGVYLLLKARKEAMGRLFDILAGAIIVLAIAYMGFLCGRGIKSWQMRDKHEGKGYHSMHQTGNSCHGGNCDMGKCPHGATSGKACGGSCGGDCDKSCGGACGNMQSGCCHPSASTTDTTNTCTGMKGGECCMGKGPKGPK